MYNVQANAKYALNWNVLNLLIKENFNLDDTKKVFNGDLNVNTVKNPANQTLLLFACKYNITDMAICLINMLANANLPDITLTTPLHWAAYNCNIHIVYALISSRAIVNSRNEFGSTPLHQACLNGNYDVIDTLILNDANTNIQDIYGKSPLHIACISQNLEAVKRLLKSYTDINIPDDNLSTPLHYATTYGNSDICKLLLSHGANLYVRDIYGNTPLAISNSLGYCTISNLICAYKNRQPQPNMNLYIRSDKILDNTINYNIQNFESNLYIKSEKNFINYTPSELTPNDTEHTKQFRTNSMRPVQNKSIQSENIPAIFVDQISNPQKTL